MLRQVVLCATLLMLSAETARAACPGQTGKPIFADNFSDDSGGWDLNAHENYGPGALQIKISPKVQGSGSLNETFTSINADYCTVIAFPADQPESGNTDYATLLFLATNYSNWICLTVFSDGTFIVNKDVAGTPTALFSSEKNSSINMGPGKEVTLRVIVKDQKITFFINGAQIKTLRAQTPDGANKFGFLAGTANPVTKERVYLVKSFSVTEAP